MDYTTSIAQHHHHHHQHRHLRNNRQDYRHPSFSSTLLDQIYNSIDDSSPLSNISSIKTKKQTQYQNRTTSNRREINDNRREIDYNLIDNRRETSYVRSRTNNRIIQPILSKNSSSSSSDSTGFSSSESDSFYKRSKSVPHPKPIRTTVIEQQNQPQQQQQQGSFIRTKSRASKIYSDLKKVKQPISPGGRIATFLNSIFTGNTKKLNKIKTGSASTTTCSSASSFSRSCLSKTPSSSEKSKRSVRFIDELEQSKSKEIRVMEENRRVIEAAKELLRNYHMNKDVEEKVKVYDEEEDEEEDDEDLFELDHLSVIGIEKFREELPVYETTRLNTNRIISR